MTIPASEKPHNDLIDFLTDACQTIVDVPTIDGKIERQMIQDPDKVWWKTHNINSSTFGRFAFELETFESLGDQCYNHMSFPRANVMKAQIDSIAKSFKYSIDAKSSETKRDKNNNQSNLIDKLNKTKSERVYSIKDDMKKSAFQGLIGKDVERDDEN